MFTGGKKKRSLRQRYLSPRGWLDGLNTLLKPVGVEVVP